jgi:glycerol-3-phosphate acyltransferase PlsY
MLKTYFIVALVAYLLGSIPFGYILVKLFLKQDIRKTGSGNIGATNVARSGKKGLAIATLLLDAAKGAAAVLLALPVGRAVLPPNYQGCFACQFRPFDGPVFSLVIGSSDAAILLTLAALSAIVGHMYPLWLGFRGGKGVATAIGAFVVLAPTAAALSFVTFGLIFASSKIVSLSSILSAALFPLYWWKFSSGILLGTLRVTVSEHQDVVDTAQRAFLICIGLVVASSLLIILKHHSNIRRLINGTEPKFGTPKQAIPADPIQAERNA